jgi:hypothetical protein
VRRDKLRGAARLGLEQLEPRLMMSATPGGMESDPFRDLLSHGGLCGCPICSGNGLAAIQVELGRTVANASYSRMAAGTPTGLPQLASRPGAAATLLLDFDGHFQSRWGSDTDIYTPPYDTDGNYGSFSADELNAIQEIWARVAEDYAPFNINVTTIDPGTNQRVARIAIGGNHSDWFGSPAGGVAYVGGFYNSAPNVAYVFEDALANGNPRYTAEAASHEAGHLFGLLHQATWSGGKLVEEYNSGNSQWAPTMGVGYYAERTTWHAGPTSNSATSIQDDLAILAGPNNGFGYVPDDYGNTISTASTLTVANGGVRLSGLIGKNDDRDVFKFTTAGGPVSFTLDVAPFGPNLDGVLELWNAAGQAIVSANPSSSQGASLSASLASGTYYVAVRSSGGYGNLGTYTLSGTLVPGTLVSPDISVSVAGSNLADGDTLSFVTTPVGTAVSRTVTITNVGGGTLALSPLSRSALPAGFTLLSNIGNTSLAAGQSTSFTVRFDAAQAGTFGGPIAISSGDGDTPSFVVRLAGTAQAAVTQSSVRILNNGDAGFRTAGAWKRAGGAGHDKDLHWSPAGNGSATASWTFTGLEAGQYRIALRDDAAAFVGGAGAEVDDPIGGAHQLQIVLDDDQRVADGQQRVETIQQLDDVGKVQAGGRFVQQEQRAIARRAGHVGRQLQPLGFAGRERVGRLPQPQVVQAHVDQLFQLGLDLRLAAEERERLAHRHLQHFGDVAAAVGDFEDLLAVPRPAALAALHVHVGQELHVDLDVAVAAARFAPPAVDVEAEMAGRVVVRPGLDRLGKHGADRIEGLDVGHRIRARRAADRVLVHQDRRRRSGRRRTRRRTDTAWRIPCVCGGTGAVQRVLDQRALARLR